MKPLPDTLQEMPNSQEIFFSLKLNKKHEFLSDLLVYFV